MKSLENPNVKLEKYRSPILDKDVNLRLQTLETDSTALMAMAQTGVAGPREVKKVHFKDFPKELLSHSLGATNNRTVQLLDAKDAETYVKPTTDRSVVEVLLAQEGFLWSNELRRIRAISEHKDRIAVGVQQPACTDFQTYISARHGDPWRDSVREALATVEDRIAMDCSKTLSSRWRVRRHAMEEDGTSAAHNNRRQAVHQVYGDVRTFDDGAAYSTELSRMSHENLENGANVSHNEGSLLQGVTQLWVDSAEISNASATKFERVQATLRMLESRVLPVITDGEYPTPEELDSFLAKLYRDEHQGQMLFWATRSGCADVAIGTVSSMGLPKAFLDFACGCGDTKPLSSVDLSSVLAHGDPFLTALAYAFRGQISELTSHQAILQEVCVYPEDPVWLLLLCATRSIDFDSALADVQHIVQVSSSQYVDASPLPLLRSRLLMYVQRYDDSLAAMCEDGAMSEALHFSVALLRMGWVDSSLQFVAAERFLKQELSEYVLNSVASGRGTNCLTTIDFLLSESSSKALFILNLCTRDEGDLFFYHFFGSTRLDGTFSPSQSFSEGIGGGVDEIDTRSIMVTILRSVLDYLPHPAVTTWQQVTLLLALDYIHVLAPDIVARSILTILSDKIFVHSSTEGNFSGFQSSLLAVERLLSTCGSELLLRERCQVLRYCFELQQRGPQYNHILGVLNEFAENGSASNDTVQMARKFLEMHRGGSQGTRGVYRNLLVKGPPETTEVLRIQQAKK